MNAVHKRAMEAAERRRSYLETEIRVSPLLVLADCQDIADGYLAEHHADDEMPVDEAWVKSELPPTHRRIGRQPSGEYPGTASNLSWTDWGPAGGLCVYIDGQGIAWRTMTRGQFRALLRGLGIDVKETE